MEVAVPGPENPVAGLVPGGGNRVLAQVAASAFSDF